MRVVGCVPVPKARPGSSRMCRTAAEGSSCQVGTIQKSGVISTGANCDCVRRTQSWSCTAVMPSTRQPSKKSCTCSSSRASSARASVENSATMRLRCQPSFGGGMPGSPKSACSASVCASASSTETLSASSASKASLKASTRSSGHIRLSSNISALPGSGGTPRAPTQQKTMLASVTGGQHADSSTAHQRPGISACDASATLPGSGCWCRRP